MKKKIKKNIKKTSRHSSAPAKAKVAQVKDSKGFSVPVYNIHGKEVGKFALSDKVFDGYVNKGLLYQAVAMYGANQRQGNASTKTRGEVSGGGKKPWRQKGTGRARAGSTRSPLWRHGGVIFGPHPRDFSFDIPKKMKKLALLASINSKLNNQTLKGIEAIDIDEPKTKKFQAIIDALKLEGRILIVLDKADEKIMKASRNISNIEVKNCRDFSAMDVLRCDNVLMSKAALEKLPERVKI